jgi:hypothetical protein
LAGVTGAGDCNAWEAMQIIACQLGCIILHPATEDACQIDCIADQGCSFT